MMELAKATGLPTVEATGDPSPSRGDEARTRRSRANRSLNMGYRTADDPTLVDAVRRGEQQALEALYDRYADRVYAIGVRLLDRDAAEDVVQETFLKLWQKPETYRPARGRFASWFLRVAHNLAVEKVRARGRRQRHQTHPTTTDRLEQLLEQATEPAADPHEQAQTDFRARQIREALQRVPEDQRRILWLAYFDGLTQAEIADQLEIPLGTVKTRARLGLQKLRACAEALKESPWQG